MMGQLGFSYVGALFLLALLLPNLFWTRRRPVDYDPSGENCLLLCLERIGQAMVTCMALVFQGFNWRPWTAWSWWLAGAVLLMGLYEIWWVRYFCSERTMRDFTASLLGIYGRVVWMLPAVAVLGVGHIGIHLRHRSQSLKREDT